MTNITTITYSSGDISVSETLTETVRSLTSGTIFTSDDIAEALHAEYPTDEGCSDLHFLKGQAKRWISRTLANPMTPSLSMHLCVEQDGKFVRK